ncbi:MULTISPECIES: FAD:protein FMN transferase [Vibrio]|uniref:FAD:protein FMN transferase n=2 Tax=Vibrio TaxID=662 RepID=A0A7X4RWI2_9VIBR|nr:MULTISPECIES: FAD:protein FMN transferase [Vibrio]MBF9002457.1 FAD:protein FMN transferase [Vibrio nitrifigilis]MZI95377.1 FAD:protein FMN transferase [Vibrio eleionomae]
MNISGVSAKFCRNLLITATVSAALAGCNQPPEIQKVQGYAQGTTYHISWWTDKDVDTKTVEKQFKDKLAQIDKELSTYRDDSYISEFNQSDSIDWQSASSDFIHLIEVARMVNRDTQGCYDPTITPLFKLWGFQKGTLEVPTADQIASVKKELGLDKVLIDTKTMRIRKTMPNVQLDFSSMGEGYTIGKLSKILEDDGIHNYLVEFGGDMKIRGHKPKGQKWRVAIERPVPTEEGIQPYKIVTINSEKGVTLDTSGTYHHSFDAKGKKYSHILDPRTGAPVTHDLVSASVFGDDPEISDAWATAMLCLGPKVGKAVALRKNLEVFFIEGTKDKPESFKSEALEKSTRVVFDK